jgi:uncharacterized protein (DUF927 family)
VFVLPERTLGGESERSIVLQAANAVRSPFATRGSLAEWRTGVAAPCEHNSRLAFAISIALAGPLLWVMGLEGGGFHLFGASSQGKTTALQAAASVWGRGDKGGFVGTWRGTANGMEGVAAMHSDAVLILDEIGQADARTVAEAGYMLAQGIGKARAGRNGEARQPARWRTLILSSGELTQAAKIGEDRGRAAAAGQMVRLLDIPSDAGAELGAFDAIPAGMQGPKDLADHIKRATSEHYGHAGPAFIEMVARDLDATRASVRGFVAEWMGGHCPERADGQVKRACDRFALVAAAGELAIACGLLPWTEGAATHAAGKMFRDWIAARGGVEASETTAGIAQVRRFIEQFGESRFANLSGDDTRVIPNRAGFRKGHDADREWIILPETWKTEVASGHEPALLARALAERGMMRMGGDGKPQVKVHIPNMGKPRAYVLTSKLFEEA